MAKTTQLKDLKANPDNPRTIADEKLALLKKAMSEFGDLSGLVHNRKTGQMVGGHQRLKVLPPSAEIVIEKTHKKPTRTGTIAEGHVMVDGERFSYRQVDWSEKKEKAANIAANKGAGEWDYKILGDWMQDLVGSNFDLDLTMFDENERKGFFSDVWDDDKDKVEKEESHVEGFRDTIKVKCPKDVKPEVVELLKKTIAKSKFAKAVDVSE